MIGSNEPRDYDKLVTSVLRHHVSRISVFSIRNVEEDNDSWFEFGSADRDGAPTKHIV